MPALSDGGSGRAGPFYLQMAEFDIVTGQSKYEDTVQKFLAFTQSTGANFSDEKLFKQLFHTLYYGRAAARAYSAYGTQIFLDYAVQAWWYGRRYTLTLDNVNSGKTNIKNYPITKSCDGVTMAGGTFWSNDTTDPDVASSPTGLTASTSLSALLAEATSDPMLKDLITVIPHTTWQQVDGILVNDQDFFPGDLVKGLGVAYARNVTSPELQNWMKAYIAVQFNALVDLSTNGTNIYAAAWQGPPSLTFDGGAQTDAIQVLLSAISFEDDSQPSSSTNGSPSPTGAPPPPPSVSGKSSTAGPIAGGVIGGIALLSCIAFVFWMVRRRQLRRTDGPRDLLPTATVTPMVFAPYGDHPFSEPLTVLAPQRAKANDDNFSLSPTSASVGDQLDVAALGGQAEYAWNSQQWRRTLESQSVVPTAQLIALLHERLRNEGNQDQPPEYPQSR
ncbi:hypothetical protein C8J57DRAFT_1477652 [Mycena rebaudengoi]|nr:hypothetical protein C8J57DRAFT_1477652 [Mycena rebaudengoi]